MIQNNRVVLHHASTLSNHMLFCQIKVVYMRLFIDWVVYSIRQKTQSFPTETREFDKSYGQFLFRNLFFIPHLIALLLIFDWSCHKEITVFQAISK